MDQVTGAARTQRCPVCTRHQGRECYTASAWGRSGTYCRECRRSSQKNWRNGQRVMKPLPEAEVLRLRAMVACLVCGAVPKVVGEKRGYDVVRANHTSDCTAVDSNLRMPA